MPVPNDPQWIAHFYKAIWRLGIQSNYERDAAHSAKIVAAKWREIWEELQVSACCGATIYDLTINTQINVQVATYLWELNQLYIASGSDIFVTFPETPVLFGSDPADAGDEIAQRNRALCLAVESFVNESFNRALSWMVAQKEEVGALVLAGLAAPPVSIYVVIAAIAAGGFAIAEVAQELARGAYRDYIVCGMFDALKTESSGDKGAFFGSADNLPPRPPPPESAAQNIARDVIEVWLRSQLNNTENYLGFIKSLNAAMGIASALEDEDCGCIELCDDYTDGFEAGLGENTYLWPDPAIPVPSRAGRDAGEWRLDAGEGFEDGGIYGLPTGTFVPPQEHVNATVFIELPEECTVTSVTFRAVFHNGGPNRAHGLAFYDAAGLLVSTIYDELYTAPGAWSFDGQGGLSVSGAKWCRIFIESRIDWDLWMTLDQIVVEFA